MNERATLHPTHHCFDDALEFLAARCQAEPALALGTSLRLVHGIALGPAADHSDGGVPEGQPFAHAWVEENDDICWHGALLNGQRVYAAISKPDYYAELRIHATTSYTPLEAHLENRASRSYGPWKPEYRALCSSRGTLVKQ